jgi:hypothetical protein
MPNEYGYVANHGLAVRDGEESFRQMASMPWAVYKALVWDLLDHIPMFDDLPVLKAPHVHDSQVRDVAIECHMHLSDGYVTLDEGPLHNWAESGNCNQF